MTRHKNDEKSDLVKTIEKPTQKDYIIGISGHSADAV